MHLCVWCFGIFLPFPVCPEVLLRSGLVNTEVVSRLVIAKVVGSRLVIAEGVSRQSLVLAEVFCVGTCDC